jgi:histidyl-tRNA synthetase
MESKLNEAIEQVRLIFTYLRELGLDEKVVLDLGVVGHYDLFAGGVVFQAFVERSEVTPSSSGGQRNGKSGKANKSTSGISDTHDDDGPSRSNNTSGNGGGSNSDHNAPFDVVAIGGRYDSLIARYQPPSSTQLSPTGGSSSGSGHDSGQTQVMAAIGVNIAIEKIISASIAEEMTKDRSLRFKQKLRGTTGCLPSQLTSQHRILLFCNHGHMLKERMKVAKELWEEGLHVEYMHPTQLSMVMREALPGPLSSVCVSFVE